MKLFLAAITILTAYTFVSCLAQGNWVCAVLAGVCTLINMRNFL